MSCMHSIYCYVDHYNIVVIQVYLITHLSCDLFFTGFLGV